MVLVFGKTRQVGIELQRSGNVFALGLNQADLSDSVAYAKKIQDFAPFAVIDRKSVV